ncbi:hypothetical protein IQ241_01215 [Romeria aff. gracilis LEGE 07310]|uniref:Uncharacterized protein n=1 Tax=Vasconcelosia minhoensis LEGE 07310 TaxID=915328 RepID=A0A8J7AEI6_9CYAN|nr:hypothetical protein [Romeria gracilis]MBE9075928.1 hypothetical protein [Romeria aff. gracilis LEGE 07310]
MTKRPKFLTWLAVASLAWGAGVVYNVYLGGETYWLKAMYQRKIALAQQIDQPKLIVTGGSGAHYTINSDLLSRELGQPVINLGIDGPVGLDVILPSVLDQVQPGDTVLLIPEYLLLLDEDGLGDRSGPFSLAIGRPGLGQIPAEQLALDTLQLGIPSLRGIVKSSMDLIETGKLTGYYDDPLTQSGDPTLDKPRLGEWWPQQIREPVSAHSVRRIQQFRDQVEARGGQLVLSLPWVYAEPNPETVENVRKTVDALSPIAPLLYDPETLNIQASPDLFADTHYHLQAEGRRLRSQQLALQLETLPNLPQPTP